MHITTPAGSILAPWLVCSVGLQHLYVFENLEILKSSPPPGQTHPACTSQGGRDFQASGFHAGVDGRLQYLYVCENPEIRHPTDLPETAASRGGDSGFGWAVGLQYLYV